MTLQSYTMTSLMPQGPIRITERMLCKKWKHNSTGKQERVPSVDWKFWETLKHEELSRWGKANGYIRTAETLQPKTPEGSSLLPKRARETIPAKAPTIGQGEAISVTHQGTTFGAAGLAETHLPLLRDAVGSWGFYRVRSENSFFFF